VPLQFAVVTFAVERLRLAEAALETALDGGTGVDPSTLAEVHEAVLELIWATGMKDLTSALAAAMDPN
jgi:hypothetical protein